MRLIVRPANHWPSEDKISEVGSIFPSRAVSLKLRPPSAVPVVQQDDNASSSLE